MDTEKLRELEREMRDTARNPFANTIVLTTFIRDWSDKLRDIIAAQPPKAEVPDGSWLWCKLMDFCRKRQMPPAEYNDLFAIVTEAHKLNTATPTAAADWTDDAEKYGNALNEAAWVFIEECQEKSALLFNNTKEPLRAAILKYAEVLDAARNQEAGK